MGIVPTFRFNLTSAVIIATVVFTGYLCLNPMGWLLFGSFWSADPGKAGVLTLDNYARAFASRELVPTLINSAIYAIGAAGLSTLMGLILAWTVVKTNTPFRGFIEIIAILPYMVPLLLLAISYTFLFSPRIGLINRVLMGLFNLPQAPFDIYSMWGMILVMAIFETPFSFLIIAAAMRAMDASLEESARVVGSSPFSTLRSITLPIIMPAVLASFLINVVRALEIFDIPAILGYPVKLYVMPTLIYTTLWSGLAPDIRGATALSTLLMVLTVSLILLYRYYTRQSYKFASIAARGFRTGVADIGKWKYVTLAFAFFYFFIAVVLPIFILAFFSFMPRLKTPELSDITQFTLKNYIDVFTYPITFRALLNSVFLAVVGAFLAVLLASLISYLTIRIKGRGSNLLESVATLPFAVPSIVLAVGLIWAYLYIPIGIYGTIWILMVGYITKFIPFGIRSVSVNMLQIHKDLEESARVSGASRIRTFYSILLPLVRPGMIAAWLILATIFLREFSMSILLYKAGSEVLPVVVFDMYINGFWPTLSAIGVLMTAISLTFAAIALRLGRGSSIFG